MSLFSRPMSGQRVYNRYMVKVVTEPASEPVTLPEAKRYLRVDGSDDDPLITSLIKMARQRAESWLGRSIITQTRDAVYEWGPAWFEVPGPPIQSITSIHTTDLANVESTVDSSLYWFNSNTGIVSLKTGAVWPFHRLGSSFRVRYVSGYGPQQTDVPPAINLTILAIIAHFFDNRGLPDVPIEVLNTMLDHRVYGSARMAKGMAREDLEA